MDAAKKTILVIDDDARNIYALSAVLKSRGFTCVSAITAKDGLNLLKNNTNINMVLLDMMMPEMDGYETIGIIKNDKSLSGLPVIAVTAQAMIGDKDKTLNAGADAYVVKPVDIDELLRLLQQYLN